MAKQSKYKQQNHEPIHAHEVSALEQRQLGGDAVSIDVRLLPSHLGARLHSPLGTVLVCTRAYANSLGISTGETP